MSWSSPIWARSYLQCTHLGERVHSLSPCTTCSNNHAKGSRVWKGLVRGSLDYTVGLVVGSPWSGPRAVFPGLFFARSLALPCRLIPRQTKSHLQHQAKEPPPLAAPSQESRLCIPIPLPRRRSDLRVWCGPGVTFAGSFKLLLRWRAGATWFFAARRAAHSTKPRARAPACSLPYLVVGSPWRGPPCRLPLLRWRRLVPRQTKSSRRSQHQARSRSACSPASTSPVCGPRRFPRGTKNAATSTNNRHQRS
jgi:hypothetical protein